MSWSAEAQRKYYQDNKDAIIERKHRRAEKCNKNQRKRYAKYRAMFDPDKSPLRAWRKSKGYTQETAAKVLGYSEASISKMELGTMGIPDRIWEVIENVENI